MPEAEHVGFSPTRPTSRAPSSKRREVFGKSHQESDRGGGGEGGRSIFTHGRIRMTIDPRKPTVGGGEGGNVSIKHEIHGYYVAASQVSWYRKHRKAPKKITTYRQPQQQPQTITDQIMETPPPPQPKYSFFHKCSFLLEQALLLVAQLAEAAVHVVQREEVLHDDPLASYD